jgi:hypothetical protein
METASRQLQSKFDAARNLFDKIEKIPANGAAETQLSQCIKPLHAELDALEIKFSLKTNHLFINVIIGKTTKTAATTEFARILASEDFAGSIDRLVSASKQYLKIYNVPLRDDSSETGGPRRKIVTTKTQSGPTIHPKIGANSVAEIQKLVDIYPNDSSNMITPIDYTTCVVCGKEMMVDSSRSELHCSDPACGAIRELVGTTFDENTSQSDSQKTKSGTFKPNRHFQFWWMHILAREPEEEIGDKDDPDNLYGDKLLKQLREVIVRDQKVLRLITVNDVRAMLSEYDRTDLNKNVPLIMKRLTGIGPPQISDSIAARAENLFIKAIEIGERIRRDNRTNRNYYPFYIFKILDRILTDEDTRRILYYIYIQSKETVEADDADWEQICAELGEIEYIPTDRTLGYKYRPL